MGNLPRCFRNGNALPKASALFPGAAFRASQGEMRIAALLLAAGTGTRFGAPVPKQFLPLLGKPVLRHAAEALLAEGLVGTLLPVGDAAPIVEALRGLPHLPPVPGGATRQASVRAGLEALAADPPDVVLIHDGARPVLPPGTLPALLAALARHPADVRRHLTEPDFPFLLTRRQPRRERRPKMPRVHFFEPQNFACGGMT
jgi:CTP:molybdopterin cytidylyltransferase MocA